MSPFAFDVHNGWLWLATAVALLTCGLAWLALGIAALDSRHAVALNRAASCAMYGALASVLFLWMLIFAAVA